MDTSGSLRITRGIAPQALAHRLAVTSRLSCRKEMILYRLANRKLRVKGAAERCC
jgi:hypothetical protein